MCINPNFSAKTEVRKQKKVSYRDWCMDFPDPHVYLSLSWTFHTNVKSTVHLNQSVNVNKAHPNADFYLLNAKEGKEERCIRPVWVTHLSPVNSNWNLLASPRLVFPERSWNATGWSSQSRNNPHSEPQTASAHLKSPTELSRRLWAPRTLSQRCQITLHTPKCCVPETFLYHLSVKEKTDAQISKSSTNVYLSESSKRERRKKIRQSCRWFLSDHIYLYTQASLGGFIIKKLLGLQRATRPVGRVLKRREASKCSLGWLARLFF